MRPGARTDPASIQQALRFHRQGRLGEAAQLCQAILKLRRDHVRALHLLGVIRLQQGNPGEAIRLISLALERAPDSPEVHSDLGIALQAQDRHEEAITCYDKALKIKPDHAAAFYNRGVSLARLNRHREAIESYDKALAIKPGDAGAHYNRGNALAKLGELHAAIASYDEAIALRPDHADALNNRGLSLSALDRHDEALESYDKALGIRPEYVNALHNRGAALASLKRHEEAIASFDKALAQNPGHAEALRNRGNSLLALNRYEEAIESFEQGLSTEPRDLQALFAHGRTLARLNRVQEAIASYRKILAIKPDSVVVLNNLGNALRRLNHHGQAIACYDKALEIDPDYTNAFDAAAHSRAQICDWKNHELVNRMLADHVRAGKPVTPFAFISVSDSPADQLVCARSYVRHRHPRVEPPLWRGERYRHDRIRLGYLSADFREHATAYLITGLFERHDREQFETIAVSFGPDKPSAVRNRIKSAFDRFIDAHRKTDGEIAKMLRELEIDIAVDLKGFTTDSRTGIFAHRPAPVQVNYLGYPGTMGAAYIDYILADRIVIPEGHRSCYMEKVVYLPDCYQVNDSEREIADRSPSRSEAGLPEHGFVFCCFNSNYKISPAVFDVWMTLLRQVEGSVLWLLEGNSSVARNLRREAADRGVAPERLVFSRLAKLPDHLARHRLADLFLDTLPCNAHTTASDALWSGLPVLTCLGTTFAGRVAASLLTAIGLPELVTHSMKEYEVLALRLATQPSLLREIKDKLERNRLTTTLFDTTRFTHNIEAAYIAMWETYQRGEQPEAFAVTPRKA